jgi:predicted metal-dependent peptidase
MAKTNNIKFQAIRLKSISVAPYLATAIWSMHPIEAEQVGTMGVDKYWRLYYNPDRLDEWTTEQSATVILHEVWHLLREHPARAERLGIMQEGDRSFENFYKARIWNLAADCEINDDLRREGLSLPNGCIFPEQFNLPEDLTAEEYYERLFDEKDMQNQAQKLKKMLQKIGKELGDPQGGCGDGDPMGGNDGSGSGGMSGEWELEPDDADNPGMSEGMGELTRQQTAHDIEKHEKNIGNTPGHVKRWAKTRLNPKIDWRQRLASIVRGTIQQAAGMMDYSYCKPSRRQSVFPRIILPTMRGPKPSVGVVIDTSGSMSPKDLEMALSEIHGITKATESDIYVTACDTKAYKMQKVFSADQIELTGGGGTDMVPGMNEVAEQKVSLCVVLTDGYTPPWPTTKPKGLNKVLIVVINGRRWGNPTETPDWAEVLTVDEND